jgi:16S rRNA (uracil1498-N3)-methyltransferase
MSATPRIFVEAALAEGARIALSDDQAHYLRRVLRLETGAAVRVFNGRDGEFAARLVMESRKETALQAEARLRAQTATPDLRLLFAPLKKTRTDFVVEKATELGVREIWPVFTERSDTERVRNDRLLRLAVEAAEQCERLDVPSIHDGRSLAQALANWEPDRPLYFCDESGDDASSPWGGAAGRAPVFAAAVAGAGEARAALLVGPEGGFSPAERNWLRSLAFVRPISLGPRILRAETAVVAGLVLWQSLAGDWQAGWRP